MRAKLIYSDLLYTASLAVFDEVKNNAKNAKKHIIIVPDKYTLICEKLLLERLGVDCSFNAEVMSINRFCSKVVKIEEKLDKQGGVILIQNILYKLNDKLQAFQNMYKQIGFAESIYATCMQIKASGISADMVSEKDADEVLLKRKLADLTLIYSAYERAVEGGLTDGLKKIEQLNLEIKSNDIFKDLAIYFAFFDFFTRQEYKIIENLIKNGNFVCVGASYGLGKLNEHIYTNEVYENISSIFFKYNLKDVVEVKEVLPLHFEKVKNELFSFSPSLSVLSGDDVALYCAEDENKEIEAVAKKIKAFVTGEKIKYNQINVGLGSIEKYRLAVENIFNKYEIPYFLDAVQNLDGTELGRFLGAIFKGASYGFMEEDLKSIIFNYYFNLCESIKVDNLKDECGFEVEDAREEVYKFINLLNPNGVKWLKREYGENVSENVKLALCEIDKKIFFIIETLKGAKSGLDYVNAVKNIFAYFNVEGLTNELADKFASDLVINKTLLQVMPKMQGLFTQIEQLSGETKFDLLSFSKLLLSGLNACKISLVPLGVDCVFVGDVSTSSFERKDICFLVGMNLSVAPKISYDLGLVTDKDIDCLSDKYVIEPKISLINMRARQKLFEIACVARKHLIISYLLADCAGATLKPSTLVSSICKMFAVRDWRGNVMPFKAVTVYDEPALIENVGDLLDEQEVAKKCEDCAVQNGCIDFKDCESCEKQSVENLKRGHSFSFESGKNGKDCNLKIEINQHNIDLGKPKAREEKQCNNFSGVEKDENLGEKTGFSYKKLMIFTENLATKDNAIKFALTSGGESLGYEILKKCNMDAYFKRLMDYGIEKDIKSNLNCAKDLFFANGLASATQLTTYFQCPYRHFLSFGLKIKEDLPFKLKKTDVGQILHRICELFANKLKRNNEINKNQFYLSGESLNIAKEEVLNAVINEFESTFNDEENRFIVANLKQEAFKIMENLNNFAKNSAFNIDKTEFNFSKIQLKNSVKSVFLAGKIDRIDKNGNKVLILDYKTGDSSLDYKKIYYGIKIQLLIYSLAVLSSGKGLYLAGFGYSPINDKYVKVSVGNDYENLQNSQIRQDYKVKGFFDNDKDCLNLLDKTLVDNDSTTKESELFNFKITTYKNGKEKLSSNLVGEESLLKMVKYVQNLIELAIENILNGCILISPYKDGQNSPCSFCKFKGICKRGESGKFREIENIKIEDLIGKAHFEKEDEKN